MNNLFLYAVQVPSKVCTLCKKEFATSTVLKNHIETFHNKNFPFKCPFEGCDKKYSVESRLKIHIQTHSSEKPFVCDICQKAFHLKADLKSHIKTHSKDRLFQCNLCGKTYKTEAHLKEHTNITHKGVKNYHCQMCGKSFGKSSTLNAHIRSHNGEKKVKCLLESCNKFFTEKGNMMAHYKRHLKALETSDTREESSDDKARNIIEENKENITEEKPCEKTQDINSLKYTIQINNKLIAQDNFHEDIKEEIYEISKNTFNLTLPPEEIPQEEPKKELDEMSASKGETVINEKEKEEDKMEIEKQETHSTYNETCFEEEEMQRNKFTEEGKFSYSYNYAINEETLKCELPGLDCVLSLKVNSCEPYYQFKLLSEEEYNKKNSLSSLLED